MKAERLVAAGMTLGEGPISLDGDRFACVDIRANTVFGGDLTGRFEPWATFDSTVSSICITDADDLLATVGTNVRTLSGGDEISLGNPARSIRLNDGKADPVGRFVGGTMADPPAPSEGSLYSFAGGTATEILPDVTISNGLCWSADGSTLFYIDSPTRKVDAFDYDLASGAISERRTVAELPDDVGTPDGMTMDAEGGLWIALWGGFAVHRYVDGELSMVIEVPTPFVTCPVFVGGDLSTLLITTASEPNPGEPGAGDVYTVEPGVTGRPAHLARREVIFGLAEATSG